MPPRRPDDAPELVDGLQRLALAACEALEDDALVVAQRLAANRDEQHTPGGPTVAAEKVPEQVGPAQGLAHGDQLAHQPSRRGGRLKCSASGFGVTSLGALLRPMVSSTRL